MKLKNLLLLLVLPLVLVSCYTTVDVSYPVPSEVNMSLYKNIAIVPTKINLRETYTKQNLFYSVEKNSNYSLDKDISFNFATNEIPATLPLMVQDRLYKILDKGDYFNVTSPEVTKRMLEARYDLELTEDEVWKRNNIDAIVLSSITKVKKEENVNKEIDYKTDAKTNKLKPYYRYYLNQEVQVEYEYKIIDTETRRCITKGMYTSPVITNKVEIDINSNFAITPDTTLMFEEAVRETAKDLRSKLVPSYVKRTLVLEDNDNYSRTFDSAIASTNRGDYALAIQLFTKAWINENDINAGLNIIKLYSALGNFEKAREVAKEIYEKTHNDKAFVMMNNLKTIINQQKQVENQL